VFSEAKVVDERATEHGGSGRVNIIYRRTDGNVGWVDPPAVGP